MAEDTIRVLRVLEYVGPRHQVEEVLKLAVHGIKRFGGDVEIRAATIGLVPDIIEMGKVEEFLPPI